MDWDERYRREDTPWERGEPAPPLVEYCASHSIGGSVLVPGCGTGHDARFLASQGCQALGMDISPTALAKAASLPNRTGQALSFKRGDFLDPNNGLSNESFDWIFEHTCFCAIEPSQRPAYVRAAARILKPGGRLLGIFFTDIEEASEPPYPTSRDEMERLFSPHFRIMQHWRPKRSFPGRENEETMYLMERKAKS